nr:helix-turn-helix domain-containing protein [Armatimonas sp.]
MPTLLDPITKPVAPNDTETASARQLARRLKGHETDTLHVRVEGVEGVDMLISGTALRLFVQVLEAMGKGHAVTVLSAQQELTPQQAAAFLGMSRTLLTSLLDRREIAFRYVGTHRRIRFDDLLAFHTEQERRHKALDELTQQAQELNMGY